MSETTTGKTLGQMVFTDLLQGSLSKLYLRMLSKSPRLRLMCVDKVVSLSVKSDELLKHHEQARRYVMQLKDQKMEAERNYQAVAKQNKNSIPLEELITSTKHDQLRISARQLMEAMGDLDVVFGRENVQSLLEDDQQWIAKIQEIKQQQVDLVTDYVKNTRKSFREIVYGLQVLSVKFPLTRQYIGPRRRDLFEEAAEYIVFYLSERFRESCRETPQGYRHMDLDEFTHLGIRRILNIFQLDRKSTNVLEEEMAVPLEHLFNELETFHSAFYSGQKQVGEIFIKEGQVSENLKVHIEKLDKQIKEYTSQLHRLSRPEVIPEYSEEVRKLPPLSPPRPGGP